MNILEKQFSSLYKIRTREDIVNAKELSSLTALRGEKFSYQISYAMEYASYLTVEIESQISDYVKLYRVDDVVMDYPVELKDEDYITLEKGSIPDVLMPIEKSDYKINGSWFPKTLWVEVELPSDIEAGNYDINIKLKGYSHYFPEDKINLVKKLSVEIINAEISKPKTIYSQWIYGDCISNAHNVEVYSEEYWDMLEKYIALASKLGINMLLTPILSIQLDTEFGTYRKNTQLLDIEKIGNKYIFNFNRLRRWLSLLKKYGIEYIEISHLFSQWGLEYSIGVEITENSKKSYMFGWHVFANSPSYKEFLEQLIPELVTVLKKEWDYEKCIFHLSDEPHNDHISSYEYAYNIVRPLIGDAKIMDACSHVEFYDKKMIDIPIPANSDIMPFFRRDISKRFVYYCSSQIKKVSNRLISMPSYRNRIMGLQMYKYNIEGFLQWGFNFYNSQLSRYAINPYVTSSANGAFPSGDPFSVYPIENDVIPSIRALVFRDGIYDIEICRLLEKFIGKYAVVKLMEDFAQSEITFTDYPRNSDFIPDFMEKVKSTIKEYTNGTL